MNVLRWVGLMGACVFFVCSCGGGDGSASPADPGLGLDGGVYEVTLKMTGFTVPPNSEIWKCQDFANPFKGKQVDIKTWDFDMTPGSHHMTLFNMAGATDGALVDCPDGVPNATSYSFGAQVPKAVYTYPDGVGETIPSDIGFTFNSHYVNTGATPIQASVIVKMVVATPGTVTQHAGGFEGVLLSISVPPTGGKPITVGSTCKLPQDVNLLAAAGHMHHRGSHFIATSGGKTLIETDEMGSPPNNFSPPMQLKAGADITWSCIYENETDAALVYGKSALTNVMCNTVLAIYPIQDIRNPLLSCFN
jgi:hypothetical protein